jgi:hypothetical protein
MNPEIVTQILNAVKDAWNFLYEIATKQVVYSVVSGTFWSLLFLIYCVWFITTTVKAIKYNNNLDDDEKGYSKFYEWLRCDDFNIAGSIFWIFAGVACLGFIISIFKDIL